MSQLDVRQDKPYRRGLVLGLTMAEIMILIIFLLLMALTAALANRDKQIAILTGDPGAQKLVAALQKAFPAADTPEELFKELVLAADAKKLIEEGVGTDKLTDQFIKDAILGAKARDIAEKVGQKDPLAMMQSAADAAKGSKKGQWPPFINLSEAGGYFFDPGSAQLKPEFELALRTTTADRLLAIIDEYGVNVIEVIGHTDEMPMVGASNLDKMLISAVRGKSSIGNLHSTDNAGLAIARAAAVTRILRADPRLADITILPMSGAQMIEPVDRLANGRSAGADQSRRRIEIRVRRSTQEASATDKVAVLSPRATR